MFKAKRKWLAGCMSLALSLSLIPATVAASDAQSLSSVTSVSTQTFSAQRLFGADRFETAVKISQAGWNSSEYAVLSAGMDANLVDALTAAPLAKAKNAPILLTEGESLDPKTEAELKRLQVKTVYVTSGSGVIKSDVTAKLQSMGLTVKALGGTDRFETSINIAKELAAVKTFTQLVATTAWTNADALSISAIAAAKGIPILLTDVNEIPASVSTWTAVRQK